MDSGFKYQTVPHVTLGSIANNPDIKEDMTQAEIDAAIARHAPQETLYDQPLGGHQQEAGDRPLQRRGRSCPVGQAHRRG